MEKLQPILKQKFWILLGIGLITTITGWWLATATLADTIKKRVEVVDGAFKKIPSGEIPNSDWATQLAARNGEQDRAINYTKALLWERQRSRMVWPASISEFAWQNGYRGEIGLDGREIYRTEYGMDVRRVWESVRPYRAATGSGIVVFGNDHRVLPQRTWGALAPTSAEMWDAQEDLWLLEAILQAVVDVNGGPEATRGDASIHVIEKLELHGGLPPSQRKASGGSGPAAGGAGPAMAGGGGGGASAAHGGPTATFGGGGDMGMGGMGGNRPVAIASADFDWREEVGDDGSGSSRGGGGGGGGFGAGPAMGGAAAAHAGAGPASATGPGSTATSSAVKRYVEDDANLPYKSRAFYMTLIMDHRKIPSLIAELSASEKSAWPIEVLRVQMVRLHDDDVGGGTSSGGSFSAPSRQNFGYGGPNTGSGPTAPGVASFEGEATGSPFNNPSRSGDEPAAGSPNEAAAAAAALDAALQDPFMARVAICGVITLYKEVKPPAAPAQQAAPAAPAAPANGVPATPEANPAAGTPTEPTTPDPQAAEGTPAEAKTADPAAPAAPAADPAKPAGEAPKTLGDTPKTTPDGAAPPENPAKPPGNG